MRNAQANDQPPKNWGIRNETLLSLPQKYSNKQAKQIDQSEICIIWLCG